MAMTTTNTPADVSDVTLGTATRANSRKRLFWVATVLSISLIPIFFLQALWARFLITPWYLPVGGTLAALMVLRAAVAPVRLLRLGVALFCFALAGLEWFFLLGMTVLPAYKGPVVVGSAVPAFHATLADGSEIDASYFQQNRPTALVFFQGRWCPFCMTQLKELEAHHEKFGRLGAHVVVVSIEDIDTAAQTQRDFPHLKVVSDAQRELSSAIDLINRHSAPDGGDSAAPTILLIDGQGKVQTVYRPTRFIARPSAERIAAALEHGSNL
jgi:peroxiredoxin